MEAQNIAPSRRPLHVHIPKTAGTSLRQALSLTEPPHMTASELRSYVGETDWEAGFSFAIVRNPFDRLVSIYAFGCAHQRPSVRNRFRAAPFSEWLRSELLDADHPRVTARRLYTEWLDENMDYIGNFEQLEEVWPELQVQLGVALPELPVIHKTDHAHYRKAFDPDSRRLVESYFAADLDRYGYGF